MGDEVKVRFNKSLEELMGLLIHCISLILLSNLSSNNVVEFGDEPQRLGLKDYQKIMTTVV